VPTPDEKTEFIKAAELARKWYVDKYGKYWVDLLEKAVAEAADEVEKENDRDSK
jgi:hypothetical protein